MLNNPKARITVRATIALYIGVLATLLITTFYPAPVEGVSIPLMLAVKPNMVLLKDGIQMSI